MSRTVVLTAAVLAAATAAAPMAVANPKPMEKTYTATAPLPDPTNFVGGDYSVCAQHVPQSFHIEEVKLPAAGALKVTMPADGYQGDWDLLLMDAKDSELAYSGGLPGVDEVAAVKVKKATTVKIVACNWAGGPTAEVHYVYTPAKK
jgi:hypothetical protein